MGKESISEDIGAVSLNFKDISLGRLYSVLFTYCELYSDYSFKIIRYPRYYLLTFNAWNGESSRGVDSI